MTNYKYKGDFEYCKLQMYTFRIHVFSSTKGQWLPIYQWSGYKLQITKGTSNNTNNKLQISKGNSSSTKGQLVAKLLITNGAIADYKRHIEYYN